MIPNENSTSRLVSQVNKQLTVVGRLLPNEVELVVHQNASLELAETGAI